MNPMNQAPEEEDNEDYDIFASVRPKGIQVDDNIEDDLDGEEVDEFEQFRPREDEIAQVKTEKKAPKKQATIGENAKDFGKQFTKETLIGLGGTWGDLAELAGVNPKQTQGSKNRISRDSDILDRMNQPGYKPSFADFESLSSDNLAPEPSGLPTSESLGEFNDLLGGPGEPETLGGKAGKRSGRIYGSGLAFGAGGALATGASLAAGAAGQGVEEVGGGPIAQAASEIVTLLASQGKGMSKTLVGSPKKEIADKINKLRELGYTEQEITLAINSASKGKKFGIKASKGSRTEQAFENFIEHSNDLVSDILTTEIPGIDRGIANVHQIASDVYGEVAAQARNLRITDSTPFINSATGVVREVRRNLGRNADAEGFLTRLANAVMDSTRNPTAENFMNFYKELNGMGKWLGRSQRDRLISQVKEGIKETFRSEGKAGRDLANRFEEANAGIRRAYQAEELHEIIQKTATQEGIDFTKFNKLFDKPDNVHLMQEVLGQRQTENLHMIAKTGREIKDFNKAYKATSLITGTPTSIATNLGYLIYSGNWATIAAMKGGEAIARSLSEKSLTDPKFQNLLIRALHAVKNESPKTFSSVNKAMQEYLDKEGVKANLTKY